MHVVSVPSAILLSNVETVIVSSIVRLNVVKQTADVTISDEEDGSSHGALVGRLCSAANCVTTTRMLSTMTLLHPSG